jgi:hypothetical protein
MFEIKVSSGLCCLSNAFQEESLIAASHLWWWWLDPWLGDAVGWVPILYSHSYLPSLCFGISKSPSLIKTWYWIRASLNETRPYFNFNTTAKALFSFFFFFIFLLLLICAYKAWFTSPPSYFQISSHSQEVLDLTLTFWRDTIQPRTDVQDLNQMRLQSALRYWGN